MPRVGPYRHTMAIQFAIIIRRNRMLPKTRKSNRNFPLNAITIVFLLSAFLSRKSACAWIPLSTRLPSSRLLTPSNMSSSNSNPFKRVKLDNKVSNKVIGTHSGTFQADEALGVWMLRQLPDYRNSKVVRSRDQKVLDKLDIVIDVGGVYDHDALRYDHHQRGYDER